jgi:hypothetical protein
LDTALSQIAFRMQLRMNSMSSGVPARRKTHGMECSNTCTRTSSIASLAALASYASILRMRNLILYPWRQNYIVHDVTPVISRSRSVCIYIIAGLRKTGHGLITESDIHNNMRGTAVILGRPLQANRPQSLFYDTTVLHINFRCAKGCTPQAYISNTCSIVRCQQLAMIYFKCVVSVQSWKTSIEEGKVQIKIAPIHSV